MKWNPRIYLVEDDPIVQRAILPCLQQIAEATVEVYDSADDFIAAWEPGTAGVLILDNFMPGMRGEDLVAKYVPNPVDIPVIMISANPDVPLAVRVVRRGVVDVLMKPVDGAELVARVRALLQDERRNWPIRAEAREFQEALATLTPRETEVLAELVNGRTNKEVAAILGISPKTVEIHRGRVLSKLRADSVTEMVRRMNVLSVDPFPNQGS